MKNYLNTKDRELQTKKMSLIETIVSVTIGYIIALVSQLIIFPVFNIQVSLTDNLLIGLFFTVVSIISGYYVRRLFNWINFR